MTKNKKTKQEIQEDAAKVLLNEGHYFYIPFIFRTRLRLTIKPLLPMTIVRVSQQVNRLKQILPIYGTTLQGMLSVGTNYRIFARIVAIAVINNRMPGRLLTGLLTSVILWKVKTPAEIKALVDLAFMQTDPEVFFYIMVSAKWMNYLESKTNPESKEVATHSGE